MSNDAVRVALKIALLTFVAEWVIMFVLPFAGLPDTLWAHAISDASLLTLIIGPAVFYWIISPYAKARDASEKELQRARDEAQSAAKIAKQATIEARSADRAKSEFLAMMSHELRTPLNAVIGFSELISGQALGPVGNEKYREYAEDIHEAGDHLLELINDILDLAKIEAMSEELHEEKIDVEGLLHSAQRLVEGRATNRNVDVCLELEPDLPMMVADLRKMKQILINLLTNAIKFSNPGGIVTVKVESSTDGIMFQVIDNGLGIAPEDIPKALSRFGQVGEMLNRTREGTGLGLPLTKSLVELHGGRFELQSELGVGTTVTLTFPNSETIVRRQIA